MLQSLLSGRGRFISHTSSWLLIIITMFYLISTIRPVEEAALRTLVNISFPIVIFYVNGRVLVNRFFETKKYWTWAILSIILWLGMAALRTKLEISAFGGSLFNGDIEPADGGWRIFLVVALIFFVLMLFSGLYQLLENRRELETLHAQAQVDYLKAQINPHFLFNTLNNIYSAATLQHPSTADMVLRLSDLLRYVTYDAQAEHVSLQKEVAHIQAYIDLFQLKAENPMAINFFLEGATEAYQIEPLLLLPLVENALKHSDLETASSAFMNAHLQCSDQGLTFKVENSFDPENQQKDEVGGVGLENIKRRLALKYQGRHQFETKITGHVFCATLQLMRD